MPLESFCLIFLWVDVVAVAVTAVTFVLAINVDSSWSAATGSPVRGKGDEGDGVGTKSSSLVLSSLSFLLKLGGKGFR